MRRIDRATAENDFTANEAMPFTFVCCFHAINATIFEQYSFCGGVRQHIQIGPFQCGFEIRAGCTATLTVTLGDLVNPNTGLLCAIKIIIKRIAQLGTGLQESVAERIDVFEVLYR